MNNVIKSIDLPYFYEEPTDYSPMQGGTIRFASLGVGHKHKGTNLFVNVANEVTAMNLKYKSMFVLIGHVKDSSLKKLNLDAVSMPSHGKPLTRDEFDSFATNIDYAVFCYHAKSYRLTASASLFDAFSYVKPIIALRNPFFEYYFDIFGDIGYLCDNYDDMKKVIVELLSNPSIERYVSQQSNILHGRNSIHLIESANKIRDLW